MAKINTGILGGFSGRLGPVVGRIRGKQPYMALYQGNVAQPNTDAQQMWKWRFAQIVRLSTACLTSIQRGFKSLEIQNRTAPNVFMMKNITDVFTGTWPELTLAYSKLVFSAGNLDLPFNPAATASETAITFTWTDNSGIGNAAATDKACVLIYNKSQKVAEALNDVAARTAATYSFTYPSAWAGDEVELYFFMSDAEGKKNSPSVYLGNITL